MSSEGNAVRRSPHLPANLPSEAYEAFEEAFAEARQLLIEEPTFGEHGARVAEAMEQAFAAVMLAGFMTGLTHVEDSVTKTVNVFRTSPDFRSWVTEKLTRKSG